jgi:hypothetical protein
MIIVRFTTTTSTREVRFANPVLAARFANITLKRERAEGKVTDVKVTSA